MPDMLVRLYDLPDHLPAVAKARDQGCAIRAAITPERHVVVAWVLKHFSAGWASECEACFSRLPVSCILAVRGNELVGFACHEATGKGFLGPMGVAKDFKGSGLGKALLLAALHAMREQGYAYAIIGGVGPADFYSKAAGAIPIPGSEHGIYKGMLPL